jgi:hypothetical protein
VHCQVAKFVDEEKSGCARPATIDFSFAFRTEKDCAMRVKDVCLQTHSDAMLRHVTIRQDRHAAKSDRRNPLAWSALRDKHRRRQKASDHPRSQELPEFRS